MGLDIGVGWPALWKRELEPDAFAEIGESFVALNEVLTGAGLPPHDEPLDLADEDVFEAQMYGYEGLHRVRRLAAYWEIKQRLPTRHERAREASQDPVLEELYVAHDRHYRRPRPSGWLSKLVSRRFAKPRFQHLLWHSDCEGFYVPQRFKDVILDPADPQRDGLGGMVGSSFELLRECQDLAKAIGLPADMDPEDEALWEAADSAEPDGRLWTHFGVEAYCLARLIRACKLSIEHKAVVLFA